jgi:hypothetical protein
MYRIGCGVGKRKIRAILVGYPGRRVRR